MPAMIHVESVSKSFRRGAEFLPVLKAVDLQLDAGTTCAIIGPSGSGKTTLLGLCAGLDQPTSGRVHLAERCLQDLDEEGLARLRIEQTGFIFQSFRLIASLTALENVMVPAELLGRAGARAEALAWLDRVGLADRASHYPAQLSGGEQQRVAIARAFINQPRIIFADEPTGNLDDETGSRILDLLFQLNRDHGTTLLLVTHDMALTERVMRVVTLKGGRVITDRHQPGVRT
jgi:putative ABC transport system ATP-binding protein